MIIDVLIMIVPMFQGMTNLVLAMVLHINFQLNYKIVTSEEILGQLKEKRGYWDKVVYLNTSLFSKSFGEIFAVLLHELCHVFGGDGRRSFSDILTYLLRMAIEERQAMDKYSTQWKDYQLIQSG